MKKRNKSSCPYETHILHLIIRLGQVEVLIWILRFGLVCSWSDGLILVIYRRFLYTGFVLKSLSSSFYLLASFGHFAVNLTDYQKKRHEN